MTGTSNTSTSDQGNESGTAAPATGDRAARARQPQLARGRRRSRRRRPHSTRPDATPSTNQPATTAAAEQPPQSQTSAQPSPRTTSARPLTWTPDVELIADLRAVPTEKVTTRLWHVLSLISPEVTLIAWLHDRPDLAPVLARIYQELRREGYFPDTTRLPQGGQRMRISRRRWRRPSRSTATDTAATPPEGPPTPDHQASDASTERTSADT